MSNPIGPSDGNKWMDPTSHAMPPDVKVVWLPEYRGEIEVLMVWLKNVGGAAGPVEAKEFLELAEKDLNDLITKIRNDPNIEKSTSLVDQLEKASIYFEAIKNDVDDVSFSPPRTPTQENKYTEFLSHIKRFSDQLEKIFYNMSMHL